MTELNRRMTLTEIKESLDCEILLSLESMDREVELVLSSDMMSDVLAFAEPGAILVTGLTNAQSVRTADFADAAAILYVRGKLPDEQTLELARELSIPLLSTKMGMFEVCGKLYSEGMRGIC